MSRLTPREVEVLTLIALGYTSVTGAPILGMSPHTWRTHTQAILVRLRANTQAHAVAIALEHGLIGARVAA